MDKIIELIKEETGATSDILAWAMFVVACLIVVFALIGIVVSIMLSIKYVKYNHKKNSAGVTGQEAARRILDSEGLQNIKVSATGSFMFGNSYSHYFHKVRLRRLTYKKDSISSMAMAAQKSALAVLDKEGDPDMKTRVKLTPIEFFGPLMFVPLVVIGVVIDLLVASSGGIATIICASLGLLFYLVSFMLCIFTLKTEKKAQEKAYEIMKNKNYATEEELGMMKELFHLYNIEYINNLILSFLELVLRVLQIVAAAQGNSNSSSSN